MDSHYKLSFVTPIIFFSMHYRSFLSLSLFFSRSLFPDYNKSSSLFRSVVVGITLAKNLFPSSSSSSSFLAFIQMKSSECGREDIILPKKISLCRSCRNSKRTFFIYIYRPHNDVEDATSNKLVYGC